MNKQEKEKDSTINDQTFKFFIKGMVAIWRLLGGQKRSLVIVAFWLAWTQLLYLLSAYIIKLVFDQMEKTLTEKAILSDFVFLLIIMLAINVVTIIFSHFVLERKFLKSLIYLENKIPRLAQEKLLHLSMDFHEKENTGKKIAKINKGCDKLIDVLGLIRWGFLPALFFLIINTIFILVIDWRVGLMFILPFAPAIWINLTCWKKYSKTWEYWETLREKSVGLIVQSVINIRTVQNFAQEEKEKKKLSLVRKKMEKIDLEASLGMQRYFVAMELILKSFFAMTIFLAVYLALKNQLSVGSVVFLVATGGATYDFLWRIINDYTKIVKELISVIRLENLFHEKEKIKNNPAAIVPSDFKGVLDFKNVFFRYQKEKNWVIKDFSIKIKPGEMIAMVGHSGEGKTTALKLASRVYDCQKGSINLDDRNIKELNLCWYRSLFAVVQQDVEIFDDSVRENIAYGFPEASLEQVKKAAKAAYLENIINKEENFPNGLDTIVGERGVKLSGGERQRVGIARAYLALSRGAKFLILDEATSNLDSQAEAAIQAMIEKMRQKKALSILVCAHRLSTISKSNAIYVISQGRIIEKGDHDSLLRKNGIYNHLCSLQKLDILRE